MAVNRSLLKKALSTTTQYKGNLSTALENRNLMDAMKIQDFSLNANNFGGGQAREIGLLAQLGTAGIGAYARNKAEKELKQQELASQQNFASQFPELSSLASQLSPATREAYTLKYLDSLTPQSQLTQAETLAKINKLQAESSRGGLDPNNIFKNANSLRQDYIGNSKDFMQVRSGYERVIKSAEDPSAAGDLSLIFAYMKTLDPTSVVREGEFATAQNSGSVPNRVIAKYNSILNGERLSQEQRQDFVSRADGLYRQAERTQEKIANQYRDIAKRNYINPDDVVIDFKTDIKDISALKGQTNKNPYISQEEEMLRNDLNSVYRNPLRRNNS